MEIRSVTAYMTPARPQPGPGAGQVPSGTVPADMAPAGPDTRAEGAPKGGEGAAGTRQRDSTRFVRDAGTNALVFQVVDPAYGEVLDQLPSESVLRNRAYAAAQVPRAATLSRGA